MPPTINGNLIASAPESSPVTVGGVVYWWYDPIYQLQNSVYFGTDVGDYWQQQCFTDGGVSGGWVRESDFPSGSPPSWRCEQANIESNNAWCAAFDDWAFAYLWSQVNDLPMPECTPATGESPGTELWIPGTWLLDVQETPNVSGEGVTPDQVLTAIQAMSPAQISQLNVALNSNPNSSPVTLQGMTSAWQRADVPTQEVFVEVYGIATTRYPENVVSIVGNLPPQYLCVLLNKLLLPQATPGNRDGLHTVVELDDSAPSTTLALVPGPPGCLQLKLGIGQDIMSGCDCETFELIVPGCQNEDDQIVAIPTLVKPSEVHVGEQIHEGNAFQIIVNLLCDVLNALHVECNTFTQFSPLAVLSGVVKTTFPFPAVQIKIQVVSNPDPARINWDPPAPSFSGGVQRYGKAQWVYADGTVGAVFFLNSNQQLFVVPTDSVVGINWYINDEVELFAYYKRADYQKDGFIPLTPSTE